jgi:hypothetical protein
MTIGIRTANSFQFQFSTRPGSVYRLEGSASLDAPRWYHMGSAFVATTHVLGVNVTPSGAGAFYRLVVVDDGPSEWTKGLERLIGYGSIAH